MRSFVAVAAFAAGTNALVGRSDGCCFHLTSSGDLSGDLGQLDDGQIRIGDNSLSASSFCIDSNGAITDSAGRGCIVTTDTTQFQCDEGATPTSGFSVSSSGKLEFNNTSDFIACQTGQNDGRNVYTSNSTSVTQCSNVQLTADSCSGSGSGSGSGGPSSPIASSPAGTASPTSAPSSVPVVPGSEAPTGAPTGTPTGTPGNPGGESPGGESPSGAPSGGGSPGGESPSGGPSGGGSPGGGSPGGGSSGGESSPPLAGSTSTVVNTVTVTDCSCSASGGPGGPAPGGSGGSPSGPGGSPSGMTSVPSAAPSGPAPSGGGGGGGSQPSGPAGSSIPSVSTPGNASPSSPGGGGGGSKPTGSASVPASSASSTPSSSGSSSGSCPTDLSGNYEYPHLIVPLDSSSPDSKAGTSFNGTVTSTISSAFNFDVPSSDAGKTCSLVFLFPELKDLETSSWSFSGDGKIDFAKLSGAVSSETTSSNVPSVAQDLGDITVSPGNSYVVSTFSCPAGETVAYEMKNAGSTNLNFFQDYNPSPLGLYITVC